MYNNNNNIFYFLLCPSFSQERESYISLWKQANNELESFKQKETVTKIMNYNV